MMNIFHGKILKNQKSLKWFDFLSYKSIEDTTNDKMNHISNFNISETQTNLLAKAVDEDNLVVIKEILKTTPIGKMKSVEVMTKKYNKRMRNILDIASRNGNIKMCETIVENSCIDINLEDSCGNTPYISAFYRPKCLQYLYSKGGRVSDDNCPFNLNDQRLKILKYNHARLDCIYGKKKIEEKILELDIIMHTNDS